MEDPKLSQYITIQVATVNVTWSANGTRVRFQMKRTAYVKAIHLRKKDAMTMKQVKNLCYVQAGIKCYFEDGLLSLIFP